MNELLAAVIVCCALIGSVAVSVLATRNLPRAEERPPAIVQEAAPAAAPAASPHGVVRRPRPGPLDRRR